MHLVGFNIQIYHDEMSHERTNPVVIFIFSKQLGPAVVPTQSAMKFVPVDVRRQYSDWSLKLTTHLDLLPR